MKESLKSVLLIILLIMAVVLTYLNTLQPFFVEPSWNAEPSSVSLSGVVRPSAIFFSYGGGAYTRIYDKKISAAVWEALAQDLPVYFDGAETVEQITRSEYADAFAKHSVLLFLPGLDRSLLASDGKLGSYPFYEEILLTDDGVFAKSSGEYFRILAENYRGIGAAAAAAAQTEGESYRRVADRFSLEKVLGIPSDAINYYPVPYTNAASVTKSSVKPEINTLDQNAVNEIAKNIFGDRLDFSQTYEDASNSVVIMYDRGRRSITFSENGELIFKNRPENNERGSFETALGAALRVISVSGGVPDGLYLQSCTVGENGEFNFEFGYSLGGYKVCSGGGEHIGVRAVVIGGEVEELRRYILVPEMVYPPESLQYFPVDQCISGNIEQFDGFADYPQGQRFFRICAALEATNMIFYSSGYTITPAWEIIVGGEVYLFDAFSGEPIIGERGK